MYITKLDKNIYRCITESIATEDVIITDEQLDHIYNHHPDAYKQVLAELSGTIINPDIILKDNKHNNTGLVIKELNNEPNKHSFVVLRICTDTKGGTLSNSIISGWRINKLRLERYLKNGVILYKKR